MGKAAREVLPPGSGLSLSIVQAVSADCSCRALCSGMAEHVWASSRLDDRKRRRHPLDSEMSLTRRRVKPESEWGSISSLIQLLEGEP